jgi:hypothetical protein
VTDALLAALAVAFEPALAGALAWAVARTIRPRLAPALAAAPLAGLLAGVAAGALAAARGASPADLAVPLSRLRQLVVLALLAGAFLARRPRAPRWWAGGAIDAALLGLAALLAVGEGAGLAALLRDQATLAGGSRAIALGAAGGLAAAAAAGAVVAAVLARAGAGGGVSAAAALALVAALKLAGPAAHAAQLTSVAVALTGVVGRMIHDGLHLAFVALQLPDHPFLREPVYQLILAFLDPLPHAIVAAVVLAAPLAAAWAADLRRSSPALPPDTRRPEARLARAAFRRRALATSAAFAVAVLVTGGAVIAAHARAGALYDPVPEPVVDDGRGAVVVPLERGGDTRLRKWVWTGGGPAVTFFAVRRTDGSLAVALDLCEICQPKGYAQLGPGYVFCKHCSTPIPLGTVGQPGGCNPIPLASARVDAGVLRISTDELLRLTRKVLEEKR